MTNFLNQRRALLGGARKTPFTPLGLFTGGVTGVWLDPSDFTTMWQDAAGTTPVTATGQNVARILDKSPSGTILTQASGTLPTLQKSTAGGYYLAFNGSSTTLKGPSSAFPIAFGCVGSNTVFFFGYNGLLTNQTDQGTNVDFIFGANNTAASWTILQGAGSGLEDATHIWINGVQTASFSFGADVVNSADGTNFPSTLNFPNGIQIGADRNNAGRVYNGRFYGAVTTSTIPTSTARRQIENYIGGKMGLAHF
jgi:hypothetical protein